MYSRNCPICNNEIVYKVKINRDNAEKHQRKCEKCCQNKKYKVCIICNKTFRGQGRSCSKLCKHEVSKMTKFSRYNDSTYNNREKSKITCMAKYNVDSVSKVLEVKEKKRLKGRTFPEDMSGEKNGMYGKKHTDESKRIMRIKRIDAINKNKKCYPGYNVIGCQVIDEYGKNHGYNFRHALNGGEFYIEYLGYYVDGYDKEKNVVIEYDEAYHFRKGKLRDRDIKRQEEITNYLKCTFIRITEEINKKINNI